MGVDKIVYLGPFAFPNGGAAARRILGNAKSLRDGGYNVVIGSGQLPNPEMKFDFEGFEVHSIGERTGENLPSFLKYFKYLSIGKKTIAWLDNMSVKPAAIILYSGYSPYFMKLLPWCKKNDVKLIFDAVEWYEASNILKAVISPYYWNIELAMRYYSIKAKNIIAISSYLKRYYELNKGLVLVVPPTVDTKELPANLLSTNKKKIVIAYTGTPGHKDLFNNYLEAIIKLADSGKGVILKVAGLTKENILQYPALKKRNITISLPPYIETLGKVSHSDAVELVKSADFSVLLRKPTRVAQAGFPTKFVESLTVGTPVIANLTSDLGDYLIDGENGLICKDYSVESLIAVLEKALKLTSLELTDMRAKARAVSEKHFDYRIYVKVLKAFIESC